MRILLFTLLITSSIFAHASCDINNAKIIQMHQWHDGTIFINFDKSGSCVCNGTNSTRVGFHKNDDEKFIMSAALSALAAQNTVSVKADGACSIHGNTSKITTFYINSN